MIDDLTKTGKGHRVALASADYNILSKGQQPELHTFEHHTALARIRGDKDILLSNGNIKTEYQKRLRDTREMKSQVQKQMDALSLELVAATGTRDTLLDLMTRVQRPLILTRQWMEVRAKEDAFTDSVGVSLKQSMHEVKDSVAVLTQLLSTIELVLTELRAAMVRYKTEIENKDITILLDKACMDDALTGPLAMIPSPPAAVKPHTPGGALNVRSVQPAGVKGGMPVQRALMQTTSLRTENEWRNTTAASISQGVSTMENSKAVRNKITSAIVSFESAGKTKRPICVVDALQQRLKINSHQCGALELNTKMIQGEIQALAKQKAMLHGSLEKVYQQLDTAEKRLAVRVVKPQGEAMRQGVEEVLEIEVIRTKQTESSLVKQLKELERKEIRLQGLVREMKKELLEKQMAINLDKKCVHMDLPDISHGTPRRDAPQSYDEFRGSTPRGSASSSQRSAAKPFVPRPYVSAPAAGGGIKMPKLSPRSSPRKNNCSPR